MQPWQYRTFCALSTYPYSYLYRTSYTVASLILALVRIYLYLQKATFLLLVKTAQTACSAAASFQVFVCHYVCKLTVWNVIDVLAGLLSAILIAVAFRHVATKSSFYFVSFYFYFIVFSHRGYCHLAILPLFSLLGLPCRSSLLSAIFNSSRHF